MDLKYSVRPWSDCAMQKLIWVVLDALCVIRSFLFGETLMVSRSSISHWRISTSAEQIDWAAMSEKGPSDLCAQQRFRSACTFMQSDQNLQLVHFGYKETSFFMRMTNCDQTVQVCRLIWVFIRCTCQKVHFLSLRQNSDLYGEIGYCRVIFEDSTPYNSAWTCSIVYNGT